MKFVLHQQLNIHKRYCDIDDIHANENTISYTAGAIRSHTHGYSAIHNNVEMGDAYTNQLHNQRSMVDIVRELNEAAATESNVDFDNVENMDSDDDYSVMPMLHSRDRDYESDSDDEYDPMDGWESYEGTLPIKFVNQSERYETMKNKVPPKPTETQQKFIYKNTLSCQATAYIELLKICQKHNVGKAVFNDIENWTYMHTKHNNDVFQVIDRSQRWSYDKTLNHAKEVFGFQNLQPHLKEVTLSDGRIVTVPVVDFAESMRSILDDSKVMSSLMSGLDPDTFRPIVSEDDHENDSNAIIHDKDSGYLYRQGIKLHCPSPDDIDPVHVRPLPIIMHIDKSHCDLFGNLSVAPVQCMPAMIDIDAQQQVSAWRQIATIPNLSSGKGKDGKKAKSGLMNLKDFHKVMGVALSSFVDIYEQGGFYWIDQKGRTVLLKPYLHFFIGDIAGVNEMVGHYNNNNNVQCLLKDCKCQQDDYTQTFPPKCSQVTWLELSQCKSDEEIFDLLFEKGLVSERDMCDIFEDADFAQSISKHPIRIAFDRLPLSDPYQGVIGLTPQEMLHMMGCGVLKYLIFGIRNVIGKNGTNSRLKGLINALFPNVKEYITKNSERDVCPMSNRNGFFNVTSLTNEEIRGNLLGLVILMQTTYGRHLLSPCFEKKGINYDEMLETLCLVLAWERFHLDPQSRQDLLDAEQVTWDLQLRIMRDIPREFREPEGKIPGSKGWTIPKFHSMQSVSKFCLKFGCSKCYDSSANEKNHKYFVKKPGDRTQHIASRFSSQLAQCDFNRLVIERSYDYIKKFCSRDHNPVVARSSNVRVPTQQYDDSDVEEDDEEHANEVSAGEHVIGDAVVTNLGGQCDIDIVIDARTKRLTVTHKWKSPLKRALGIEPCLHLHSTVGSYLLTKHQEHNVELPDKVELTAYTHATVNGVKYRANSYWKGGEWYDWCVVRFPETKDSNGGETCLARIMGFYNYASSGMLTYKTIEMEGVDASEAIGRSDDTLYVVLHCQKKYFKHAALEHTFFRKFRMMDHSHMYILPVNCIRGPMLVVPDIVGENEASKENYMTFLSSHHMGPFFKHHVHWFKTGIVHDIDDEYLDEW